MNMEDGRRSLGRGVRRWKEGGERFQHLANPGFEAFEEEEGGRGSLQCWGGQRESGWSIVFVFSLEFFYDFIYSYYTFQDTSNINNNNHLKSNNNMNSSDDSKKRRRKGRGVGKFKNLFLYWYLVKVL